MALCKATQIAQHLLHELETCSYERRPAVRAALDAQRQQVAAAQAAYNQARAWELSELTIGNIPSACYTGGAIFDKAKASKGGKR